MSLFARFAILGALLLAGAILVVLLVWKPASQASFAMRTDVLLRDAERDFGAIATSLVDKAMGFATATAYHADEQRAQAIEDLPLSIFMDDRGALEQERLRDALRQAVFDPGASAAKHAAVRAEMGARAQREVEQRLVALRTVQSATAARHADREAARTAMAWGGMLLLLFAGWSLLLDRVVLRPLRDATDAIGRFGAGERGLRLASGGASEIAALSRAFNGTAAAVEETEQENAELRSGLERKVEERTAALVRAARASTAGTMARGVAHEFNNLLGGILGCARTALEEETSDEVREALEMVCKTATRGVGVTKAMLRATRAAPDLVACDPAALFDEALAEVRPGGGIEVVRRFQSVEMEADAAMLRQVLANLVRNAVEAMGERGRLTLSIGATDSGLELRVADTGPGIEPAVMAVLFEPFVTTRQGGREGAGLGLFLAERLVVAHGGTIEVESEAGHGTEFRILLPRA